MYCVIQHSLPSGWEVTSSSLKREVWSSNLSPVKLSAVLPTACHRCYIYSKKAVLPAGAMIRRWTTYTRYVLWRKTASIINVWFGIIWCFDDSQCILAQTLFLSCGVFEKLWDIITCSSQLVLKFAILHGAHHGKTML